ncbi:AAA family ATPase [Nannocystaceae bacterium ST9]
MSEALATKLERSLRAGTRALALLTSEEARALELFEAIGERLDWPVHTWSAAAGVDGGGRERELSGLLARLHEASEPEALWLLFDACASLREPGERRRLRELAQRSRGPALILIEPRANPTLIDMPELTIEALALPEPSELAERVRAIAGALRRPELAEQAESLARAALGLELDAFDRLLAEALLAEPSDPLALRAHVARNKPARLARDGLLEPCEPAPIGELGGLDRYVAWLGRRALALAPEARAHGIPAPRGALLVGVQGCGKSLAARASADRLGLPLIRLDLARLFGGTVGESEANLRRATATLERMAPIVLWLDEIDKGLAGVDGGRSDAGTAARVVGSLLTWLQERERPVFVVATANRIDALPPELLRRGRLDELFFVDLPDREARALILAIHLERRPARELGAIPPLADPREAFLELARSASGFSGAELEAALIEARLDAFSRGEPLAAADLDRALRSTVPLARSHAAAIDELRRWAVEGARKA